MIKDITTQCWILALFVRDDGERILLGSGNYEFREKQMHFYANRYVNDTVDIQGNDGLMLAGQVRRASTQPFDGYIGGPSYTQQEVEQYRRDFLKFFRKNHYYEVIYIFQDGTAIKRNKGFIVDAPEVKEIRQLSPEYHVSLNFEDVNYYEYQEDADGNEIYSDSANIPLSTVSSGGLIWDEYGIVWQFSGTGSETKPASGSTINIVDGAEVQNLTKISGNADQNGTPTPADPVPVEVVTGEITVTVSNGLGQSKTETIDLGSVELCKAGNYQDYIYKSGDDWYIHKEIDKIILNGSNDGTYTTAGNGTGGIKRFVFVNANIIGNVPVTERTTYCNIYQGVKFNQNESTPNSIAQWERNGTLVISTNSTTMTLNEFKTSLANNPATVYYVVTSPTDTQITDASLSAQLESLDGLELYSGSNTITAAASGLPAPLNLIYIVSGLGGAVWEDGGGAGVSNVQVDSIDMVYPVLTIDGPAQSPTIENLTTNTSISFAGNINSSQTLVIDSRNQTALLNGTSVVTNIEGDWPVFAPGINRVSYTAENDTAPDALIEWSEVVG